MEAGRQIRNTSGVWQDGLNPWIDSGQYADRIAHNHNNAWYRPPWAPRTHVVDRHENLAEAANWTVQSLIHAIGQMSISFSRMSIPWFAGWWHCPAYVPFQLERRCSRCFVLNKGLFRPAVHLNNMGLNRQQPYENNTLSPRSDRRPRRRAQLPGFGTNHSGQHALYTQC